MLSNDSLAPAYAAQHIAAYVSERRQKIQLTIVNNRATARFQRCHETIDAQKLSRS
jgi:predicted HAD superfamily phosphohydrolase YqeG